jgi:hypothetical protein
MSAYSQLHGLYPEGSGPNIVSSIAPSLVIPPYKDANQAAYPGSGALPNNLQPVPIHTVFGNDDLMLKAYDS